MSEKKACASCGRNIKGTPLVVPTATNDVSNHFHASPSECAAAGEVSAPRVGQVDRRKRQKEFHRDMMGWKYE